MSFRKKIIQAISDHHQRNPLFAEGLELPELSGKLGFSKSVVGKLYLQLLLKQMLADGILDNHNKSWIIKGHQPKFDKQSLQEIDWLNRKYWLMETTKLFMLRLKKKP